MAKAKLSYYQRAMIHDDLDKMVDWAVDACNGNIVGKAHIIPQIQIGDCIFRFTIEPVSFGERTTKIYEKKLGLKNNGK
jgi:hypothetical protein